MTELYHNSRLFRDNQPPQFPILQHDRLIVGQVLGVGGFCQVHHVTILPDDDAQDDNQEKHHHVQHRQQRQQRQQQQQQPQHLYAIKFLKKQTMVDKERYVQGATDLAVEVNFLAALSRDAGNKHIVKLHGIAHGKIKTEDGGCEKRDLFIVMDQLVESLAHRLTHTWKEEQQVHGGIFHSWTRISHDFQKKRLEALQVRLKVMLEVAEAMRYLHSRNVIFRDLKPENVGFDSQGVVKLYDFGLAMELKHRLSNGKYDLTGGAGSIRYMAPEVSLRDPYDSSVDVYSFGVLLYHVAGLKKPFDRYDANDHMQHVVKGRERPHMLHWFPEILQCLIAKCWAHDSADRPTFHDIVKKLADYVEMNPEDLQPLHPSLLKSLSNLSSELLD